MKEIKTKLIYTLKYILIFVGVCLCAIFERSFLAHVSFGKFFGLSFVICAVLSLKAHRVEACVVSGLCGLFADIYSVSLPYFSLIYLYISLGCVWCESFFASLKGKTVFLICFLVFFAIMLAIRIFDMLTQGSLFLSWEMFLEVLLFAFINSAFSPIVFAVLKRVKL